MDKYVSGSVDQSVSWSVGQGYLISGSWSKSRSKVTHHMVGDVHIPILLLSTYLPTHRVACTNLYIPHLDIASLYLSFSVFDCLLPSLFISLVLSCLAMVACDRPPDGGGPCPVYSTIT